MSFRGRNARKLTRSSRLGNHDTYALRRLLDIVARDGLKLVERASRVLQAAARDHRDLSGKQE